MFMRMPPAFPHLSAIALIVLLFGSASLLELGLVGATNADSNTVFKLETSTGKALALRGPPQVNANAPPSVPALLTPMNYQKSGAWATLTRPEFTFNSTDPDANPISYNVQVSTDPPFAVLLDYTSGTGAGFSDLTSPAANNPFPSGDTIKWVSPVALTNASTYWWRARATDPGGSITYTIWSAWRSFTIDSSTFVQTWYQTTMAQFTNDTLAPTPGPISTLSGGGDVELLAPTRLFDRWNDNEYATNPTWTPFSGAWSATNGYLESTDATNSRISTPLNFISGSPQCWEMRFRHESTTAVTAWRLFALSSTADTAIAAGASGYYLKSDPSANQYMLFRVDGASAVGIIATPLAGDANWHMAKICRSATGLWSIYRDGSQIGSATDVTYTSGGYIGFNDNAADGSHNTHHDNLYVNRTDSAPIGTVTSAAIAYSGGPADRSNWGTAYWTKDLSAGGTIGIKIQTWDGAAWVDSGLSATTSPIDISSLGTASQIRLVANLDTLGGMGTPKLLDWEITWTVPPNPVLDLLYAKYNGATIALGSKLFATSSTSKKAQFVAQVHDLQGGGTLQYVDICLDGSCGTALQKARWTAANGTFWRFAGSGFTILGSSSALTVGTIKLLTFDIQFLWTYPDVQTSRNADIDAVDVSNNQDTAPSPPFTNNTYMVENRLALTGSLTAYKGSACSGSVVTSGVTWVPGNQALYWCGFNVAYLGTNENPVDADFDLRITDLHAGSWTQTAGPGLGLSTIAPAVTDANDTHNIATINIPAGGVPAPPQSFTLKVDATNPTINGLPAAGWKSANLSVTPTAADSESGVIACQYQIDDTGRGGGPELPWTNLSCGGSFAVTVGATQVCQTQGPARCNVQIRSIDNAGNIATPQSVTYDIDFAGPSTTDNAPGPWQSGNVTVLLNATDAGSGVAGTEHCVDANATCIPSTNGTSVVVGCLQGVTCPSQYVRYRSTDNLGVVEPTKTSGQIRIDREAPSTVDNSPVPWQSANVTVALSSSDLGAGVANTSYCVDTSGTCSPAIPGTSVPVICATGTVCSSLYIRYRSSDQVGNIESIRTSGVIRIDRRAPTTTDTAPSVWQGANITVTLTPTDSSGSGISNTQYCVDATGACTPSSNGTMVQVTCSNGTACPSQFVRYRSTDNVGNVEAIKTSAQLRIDLQKPTTVGATGTQPWSSSNASVSLLCSDSVGSGCSPGQPRYCIDTAGNCAPTTAYAGPVALNCPAGSICQNYLRYRSEDNVGNPELPVSALYRIDMQPPTGTVSYANGYLSALRIVVDHQESDGSGSGLASWKMQRRSAALATGSCGSYTQWLDIASKPVSPYNDTGVVTGKCYQYRMLVTDLVGRSETIGSGNSTMVLTSGPSITIVRPAKGSWQTRDFTLVLSEQDQFAGLSSCSYAVLDAGAGWTVPKWTARQCGLSLEVSVGAGANCPTEGFDSCTIFVKATSGAGQTAEQNQTFSIDYIPPEVISSSPQNGSVNVPVDAAFAIGFSKPMDRQATNGSISISPSTGALKFVWNGNTLNISGLKMLPGAAYRLTVGQSARDIAGLPLALPYVVEFRTASVGEEPAPPENSLQLLGALGAVALTLAAIFVAFLIVKRRRAKLEKSSNAHEFASSSGELADKADSQPATVESDVSSAEMLSEDLGVPAPEGAEPVSQESEEEIEIEGAEGTSAHDIYSPEGPLPKVEPPAGSMGGPVKPTISLRRTCPACGAPAAVHEHWCLQCGEDLG